MLANAWCERIEKHVQKRFGFGSANPASDTGAWEYYVIHF